MSPVCRWISSCLSPINITHTLIVTLDYCALYKYSYLFTYLLTHNKPIALPLRSLFDSSEYHLCWQVRCLIYSNSARVLGEKMRCSVTRQKPPPDICPRDTCRKTTFANICPWIGLRVTALSLVHSRRTELNCSARTAALQPIILVMLTRVTNNASCNWVSLVSVTSVQFSSSAVNTALGFRARIRVLGYG